MADGGIGSLEMSQSTCPRASSPYSRLQEGSYGNCSDQLSHTMVQSQQKHLPSPFVQSAVQQQQHQRINEKNKEETAGLNERISRVSNGSMHDLEDLLKKLNPYAEEFVPPARDQSDLLAASAAKANARRNKYASGTGKQRFHSRTSRAQREEAIRRTVYVSDIDQQVTEEQLAALFITCGQVVDCRICGDPNSVLRFAFVEFTHEDGARAALNLAGTMLGFYPVRVLPSKTAIVPVNPTFLPRSENERELCARTIYCTNIDQKAESAIAALNCSGAILGSLPIRVTPSKTPVRAHSLRPHSS